MFIHNYKNYANIAWANTSKSELERLYRCQKNTVHVIYHKDRYTRANALLNGMKTLNFFQLDILKFACSARVIIGSE